MNIYNRNPLSPLRNNGLPSLELRRGPTHVSNHSLEHRRPSARVDAGSGGRGDKRAVRLEGAPRAGVVGDGAVLVPWPVLRLQEGVLGGGLVDEVGDPGVPAGADLGAAGAVSVCSLGVQLALNLSCGFAGVLGKWCVVLWDRGARGGWGEGMRGGVVRNVRVVVVLGVFNPAGTDYLQVSILSSRGAVDMWTYAAARPCSRRTCSPPHPSRPAGRTWCRLFPLASGPPPSHCPPLPNRNSSSSRGVERTDVL